MHSLMHSSPLTCLTCNQPWNWAPKSRISCRHASGRRYALTKPAHFINNVSMSGTSHKIPHSQAVLQPILEPQRPEHGPIRQFDRVCPPTALQKVKQGPSNLYIARKTALGRLLGSPALLETGLEDGRQAMVYAGQSRLSACNKADCMQWASELLDSQPTHQAELMQKQHTQLQLEQLLQSKPGSSMIHLLRDVALQPFVAAGMQVAAFELVLSQHNIQPKPHYKGHVVRNKLGCHHQDLRSHEPWFNKAGYQGLPGGLRCVFDLNPNGQRWFEFLLLRQDRDGLYMDRYPLLRVFSDLVAFDRLAAGSGGFSTPGSSWIFHARRSHSPSELGVSIVADLVVTAGLDGDHTALIGNHHVSRFFNEKLQ